MNNNKFDVNFIGHVNISDVDTGEVLIDQTNAIHAQNMARVIGRGLANESNSIFHRLALGNGGTFIDVSNNTVYRAPNDGNNGGGWESRLYHETYSEVIDEESPLFGTDGGSAGADNVRSGGGASPSNDPLDNGSFSQEASQKSNVTIRMFINTDEPSGQLSVNDIGGTLGGDEKAFLFDELGIYSPGKPAIDTSGFSTVNVGNKTSIDIINLPLNATLTLEVDVDGISYVTSVKTPIGGTGPNGELTFGDFCEGINDGSWIIAGDLINQNVYVYISDRSNSAYPSIAGKESFGQLIFQSNSVGDSSTVLLVCTANSSDFFNVLTNGNCGNCNLQTINGQNAGVKNDSVNPENERERLLTHLVFDPILKYDHRNIQIIYTITVSVTPTEDSCINLSGFDGGGGVIDPTPEVSPTPTTTLTVTPTPEVSPTPTTTLTVTPTTTLSPTPTTTLTVTPTTTLSPTPTTTLTVTPTTTLSPTPTTTLTVTPTPTAGSAVHTTHIFVSDVDSNPSTSDVAGMSIYGQTPTTVELLDTINYTPLSANHVIGGIWMASNDTYLLVNVLHLDDVNYNDSRNVLHLYTFDGSDYIERDTMTYDCDNNQMGGNATTIRMVNTGSKNVAYFILSGRTGDAILKELTIDTLAHTLSETDSINIGPSTNLDCIDYQENCNFIAVVAESILYLVDIATFTVTDSETISSDDALDVHITPTQCHITIRGEVSMVRMYDYTSAGLLTFIGSDTGQSSAPNKMPIVGIGDYILTRHSNDSWAPGETTFVTVMEPKAIPDNGNSQMYDRVFGAELIPPSYDTPHAMYAFGGQIYIAVAETVGAPYGVYVYDIDGAGVLTLFDYNNEKLQSSYRNMSINARDVL